MADKQPPAKRARQAEHHYELCIRRLTFYRTSLSETFDVLVGSEGLQQRFTLHGNLFIPRSEFFRAARSSAWCKDPKTPTTLENDDPAVFENYMHCIYLGDVTPLTGGKDLSNAAPTRHIQALVRLYVLADSLSDLMTANLVIDKIYEHSRASKVVPNPETISLAYNNTAPGSPLRAMFRDLIIHEASSAYLDPYQASDVYVEFYRDFMHEFLTIKFDHSLPEASIRDAFH